MPPGGDTIEGLFDYTKFLSFFKLAASLRIFFILFYYSLAYFYSLFNAFLEILGLVYSIYWSFILESLRMFIFRVLTMIPVTPSMADVLLCLPPCS